MFIINSMTQIGIDKTKLDVYKATKKDVLLHIVPTAQQLSKETKFVDSLIKKIEKMKGKHVSAVVAGSFGKGTNLNKSKDFDIFVLYPPEMPREDFVEEGLSLGKQVFKGYFCEKAYSEHPYMRGVIDGFNVEIVPAYNVPSAEDMISSVDRTVFHLAFINKNMKISQKDEVRLLKYFMQVIGCYGSDSEISGFSGYLCELLVLYYGDFLTLLRHSANWEPSVKFTLVKEQDANLARFDDSLVVIDPVDSNRNVAAAVSDRQLSVFIAASRVFLQNPVVEFFHKRPVKQILYTQLVGLLEHFPMAIVEFSSKEPLKEIVWSKLKKHAKKLTSHLEFLGFEILKSELYYSESDDKTYIFMMLDSLKLSKLKLSTGPLVSDMRNSQNYLDNTKAILGPYIKENRWYSVRLRDKIDLAPIITEFAMEHIEFPMTVYVGDEVRDLYLQRSQLVDFFSDFFVPKEKFLL